MSAATTGAPQPLIASIAASAGARGAPENPVPKIASTTTPEPASAAATSPGPTCDSGALEPLQVRRRVGRELVAGHSSSASTSYPVSASRRAATSPSPPLLPLPQTTRAGPGRATSAGRLRDRRPRRLHQLERRDPLLVDRPGVRRPHPGGVVDGSSQASIRAQRIGRSRVGELAPLLAARHRQDRRRRDLARVRQRHLELDAAPARPAAARPCSRSRGASRRRPRPRPRAAAAPRRPAP